MQSLVNYWYVYQVSWDELMQDFFLGYNELIFICDKFIVRFIIKSLKSERNKIRERVKYDFFVYIV